MNSDNLVFLSTRRFHFIKLLLISNETSSPGPYGRSLPEKNTYRIFSTQKKAMFQAHAGKPRSIPLYLWKGVDKHRLPGARDSIVLYVALSTRLTVRPSTLALFGHGSFKPRMTYMQCTSIKTY